MKTFEEKFTAWVDGQLKGRELAEFEAELSNVNEAELDKIAARNVGNLLRGHGRAPELQNADFFNHQLMRQIEADQPKPAAARAEKRAWFSWSLSRMALAGALSIAVAFGLYEIMIPQQPLQKPAQSQGIVQIITTKGGDEGISAVAYQSRRNDVTVLWLDGLKYIPDQKKDAPEKKAQTEKKQDTK